MTPERTWRDTRKGRGLGLGLRLAVHRAIARLGAALAAAGARLGALAARLDPRVGSGGGPEAMGPIGRQGPERVCQASGSHPKGGRPPPSSPGGAERSGSHPGVHHPPHAAGGGSHPSRPLSGLPPGWTGRVDLIPESDVEGSGSHLETPLTPGSSYRVRLRGDASCSPAGEPYLEEEIRVPVAVSTWRLLQLGPIEPDRPYDREYLVVERWSDGTIRHPSRGTRVGEDLWHWNQAAALWYLRTGERVP